MKAISIKTISISMLLLLCSCSTMDLEENIISESKEEIVYNRVLENINSNSVATLEREISKEDKSIIYPIELNVEDIDGIKYGTGQLGNENLEDGVTFLFAIFDEDEIKWLKSWNNIQVSELSYYSGLAVVDDKILLAVNGTLNSLFIDNGELDYKVDNIGFPLMPPVVDKSGDIYLICERKPYLTIISSDGAIKAQLNSDKLYGIQNVSLKDNQIVAEINDGVKKELIIEDIEDFK